MLEQFVQEWDSSEGGAKPRSIIFINHTNGTTRICTFTSTATDPGTATQYYTWRRITAGPVFRSLQLENNSGLFDDEENKRRFLGDLRNSSVVTTFRLSFCQWPGDVLTTRFQAFADNSTLTQLYAYDRIQLDGTHLQRMLGFIAQTRNLLHLHVNLDFANESVLSSFHRNTSILFLYNSENGAPIDDHTTCNDRAMGILHRNNRITISNQLLNSEPQRMIPLGLWAHGLARITYG